MSLRHRYQPLPRRRSPHSPTHTTLYNKHPRRISRTQTSILTTTQFRWSSKHPHTPRRQCPFNEKKLYFVMKNKATYNLSKMLTNWSGGLRILHLFCCIYVASYFGNSDKMTDYYVDEHTRHITLFNTNKTIWVPCPLKKHHSRSQKKTHSREHFQLSVTPEGLTGRLLIKLWFFPIY